MYNANELSDRVVIGYMTKGNFFSLPKNEKIFSIFQVDRKKKFCFLMASILLLGVKCVTRTLFFACDVKEKMPHVQVCQVYSLLYISTPKPFIPLFFVARLTRISAGNKAALSPLKSVSISPGFFPLLEKKNA